MAPFLLTTEASAFFASIKSCINASEIMQNLSLPSSCLDA